MIRLKPAGNNIPLVMQTYLLKLLLDTQCPTWYVDDPQTNEPYSASIGDVQFLESLTVANYNEMEKFRPPKKR